MTHPAVRRALTDPDSLQTLLEFEAECLRVLRARLVYDGYWKKGSGRAVLEMTLVGWPPDTKIVLTVQEPGGATHRWEESIWDLHYVPSSEDLPELGDAQTLATIILAGLMEPDWGPPPFWLPPESS